jgi:hypothetical protein
MKEQSGVPPPRAAISGCPIAWIPLPSSQPAPPIPPPPWRLRRAGRPRAPDAGDACPARARGSARRAGARSSAGLPGDARLPATPKPAEPEVK